MTPISRRQVMIGRLQATLDAIAIVRPALEKFYDSLTDEQRASRFRTTARIDDGRSTSECLHERKTGACRFAYGSD
jgi:hypothetical protein